MVGIERQTLEKISFCNISGAIFSLDEMAKRIKNFVEKNPLSRYHIIIGSDSDSAPHPCFATAVSVWRQGNGGIYFWTKKRVREKLTWRDRIYKEVMYSITLAQEMRTRLKQQLGEDIFWDEKIHIDVGENGKTCEIKDAVIGMVRGYGFESAIKPEAFGASIVADRHTGN